MQNDSRAGIIVYMHRKYWTVPEAANRLGVSPRRVRTMAANGLLTAERAGGNYIIDGASLNEAVHSIKARGRPWTPRIAWAALEMLSGGRAAWLQPAERYRLKISLTSKSAEQVVAAARKRATVRRFRATPDIVAALREHVTLTGSSAMRDSELGRRFDLAGGGGFVDGYVPKGVTDQMVETFGLQEGPEGNVVLRETEFGDAMSRGLIPVAAVAVDLCESMATREKSAGKRVLEDLLRG